jgi:hypothetical protein
MTVIGIQLFPTPAYRIGTVDIVATRHTVAATKVWLLLSKTPVVPVFAEGQSFLHAHCINDKPAPADAFSIAAGADDPVADCSMLPYLGLACCKRAKTAKGVWSEPAIIGDDVAVKDGHNYLINRTGDGE